MESVFASSMQPTVASRAFSQEGVSSAKTLKLNLKRREESCVLKVWILREKQSAGKELSPELCFPLMPLNGNVASSPKCWKLCLIYICNLPERQLYMQVNWLSEQFWFGFSSGDTRWLISWDSLRVSDGGAILHDGASSSPFLALFKPGLF